MQPTALLGGESAWFLVRDVTVLKGIRWVRVLPPVRPNGTMGWMRASNFSFRPIDIRSVVDLSARSLTLYRGSKLVRRFPVAVGSWRTPTPTGRFTVAELVHTGDSKAFLGPVVLPLTAFSNHLTEYAGGNGRVAIHGTS